jgi:hypothetical protein
MLAVTAPCRSEAGDSPSLVLITLDTTRADRIGAYGGAVGLTPVLDELARRGAVFERTYAVTPVTLPSHASILTGRYPPAHGVRDNGIHALPASADTLAEALRDRGYHTAAFVSAAVLARRFGLAQGFEVYDDDLTAGRAKDRPTRGRVALLPLDTPVRSARPLRPAGSVVAAFRWASLRRRDRLRRHRGRTPPGPSPAHPRLGRRKTGGDGHRRSR